MPSHLLTQTTASITELKRDPMGTLNAGAGTPVAILNHNKPAFYCVPVSAFDAMMEMLDDIELTKMIESRRHEKSIPVSLADL